MSQPRSVRRLRVEYDPRLVEETVLLHTRGFREEYDFRRSRDRIYLLPEGEEREQRFQEFHAAWFARLELGRPITNALEEQPLVIQQINRCVVFPARSRPEEGADLHQWSAWRSDESGPQKTILIRVRPTRLLEPFSLQSWLRHELMHVADMLNPDFGYEPGWPGNEAGPIAANLLRERYRVLWDTSIDGRLFRRGWLPEGGREKRLKEFLATFSASGRDATEKFEEIFRSDCQTHARLTSLARNPGFPGDPTQASGGRPQPCPLCRFPTVGLLHGEAELAGEIAAAIHADFPAWQPGDGLCRQCADLYQAREMSRSAAALLPGI